MPRINDVTADAAIRQLNRRDRQAATASPLPNASISRGALVVQSAEGLIVNGSQKVAGTSVISGTETVTGTEIVNGLLQVNGTAEVNGPFGVYSSGAFFNAGVILLGTSYIAAPTTTNPVNARLDTVGGQVQRVTSSSRYKIDPQKMYLDRALLDVPVVWWIDVTAAETISELLLAPRPLTREQQARWDSASLRRVPGVVADAVVEAGGEAYVDRNEAGEIDSFAYDRFTLARTEILADENTKLRAELAQLRKEVAEIRELLSQ